MQRQALIAGGDFATIVSSPLASPCGINVAHLPSVDSSMTASRPPVNYHRFRGFGENHQPYDRTKFI
jgi:hypothetical protein